MAEYNQIPAIDFDAAALFNNAVADSSSTAIDWLSDGQLDTALQEMQPPNTGSSDHSAITLFVAEGHG